MSLLSLNTLKLRNQTGLTSSPQRRGAARLSIAPATYQGNGNGPSRQKLAATFPLAPSHLNASAIYSFGRPGLPFPHPPRPTPSRRRPLPRTRPSFLQTNQGHRGRRWPRTPIRSFACRSLAGGRPRSLALAHPPIPILDRCCINAGSTQTHQRLHKTASHVQGAAPPYSLLPTSHFTQRS